jgi:hypothetical protein
MNQKIIKMLKKKRLIKEMKNILVDAIGLDNFLQYHNASLVAIFKPKNIAIVHVLVSFVDLSGTSTNVLALLVQRYKY